MVTCYQRGTAILISLFCLQVSAGGNTSGGGSDAAAIRYLDYSLPKSSQDQIAVAAKVQKKIGTFTQDQLHKRLKEEFFRSGQNGLAKVKELVPKIKLFTDHYRGEVFELKPEYLAKAEELLKKVAGPDSGNDNFKISAEILDEHGRVLIGENWPDQQLINLNFLAWYSLEFAYKSAKDVHLLKEAIAVHEILSLHPLKIEYTNSYSVSINILAYGSKNANEVHRNGLRSISDNFGIVGYRQRPPIDLEAPPAAEAERVPQSLGLALQLKINSAASKKKKPAKK